MELNEIAKGILKAASLNNHYRMIAGLQKDKDQQAYDEAMEKIKEAEQSMMAILTKFKQNIIEECK